MFYGTPRTHTTHTDARTHTHTTSFRQSQCIPFKALQEIPPFFIFDFLFFIFDSNHKSHHVLILDFFCTKFMLFYS